MKKNIEMMLLEAEVGARSRVLYNLDNLNQTIKNMTKKLYNIIGSKSNLKGTKVTLSIFAEKFPAAYKGIPMGTEFSGEFDSKGNFKVERIYRTNINHMWILKVEYSDIAKEAIIKNNSTF